MLLPIILLIILVYYRLKWVILLFFYIFYEISESQEKELYAYYEEAWERAYEEGKDENEYIDIYVEDTYRKAVKRSIFLGSIYLLVGIILFFV